MWRLPVNEGVDGKQRSRRDRRDVYVCMIMATDVVVGSIMYQ